MKLLKPAKKILILFAAAAVLSSAVCEAADTTDNTAVTHTSDDTDSIPEIDKDITAPLKNTGYFGEPRQLTAMGSYMNLCVGQSAQSIYDADTSRTIVLDFEEGYLTLRNSEKYITGLELEGFDTSEEVEKGIARASYYYGSKKFEISIPYSVTQWRLTLKGGKTDLVLIPDSELKIDLHSYYERFKLIDGFIGWREPGGEELYTTECVMTSPDMTLEPVISGNMAVKGENEGEYLLNECDSYSFSVFKEKYEDCRVLTMGKDVLNIDTAGYLDVFPNLEEIRVEDGNKRYYVKNGVLCCENTVEMVPSAAKEVIIPENITKLSLETLHGIKAERIVFLPKVVPEIVGVCENNIYEAAIIVVPDSENDAVFCRYLANLTYANGIDESRIKTEGNAQDRNFFDGNAVYERSGDDVILKYVSSYAQKLFRTREDTTIIAPDCFADCHDVSSVIFEANLRQIEGSCFDGLNELCTLGFKSELPPAGLDRLKKENVAGAKLLLPADDAAFAAYTEVLGDAFGGNVEERFIRMLPGYEIDNDGVITSADSLISVPNAFYGVLTLDPQISKIAAFAAKDCDSLRMVVTGGNNITEIGKSAFERCNALLGFDGAQGENCVNLAQQTNLTYLGENAFAGCPYIKSVSFPVGLETVEAGAFSGCVQLSKVSGWGGVTTIGRNAFRNTGFYTFDMRGGGISRIESGALADCAHLDTLVCNATLDTLEADFTNEGRQLLTVCSGKTAAPLSGTDFTALIDSHRLYNRLFTTAANDAEVAAVTGMLTEPHEGTYFVPENRSGVYVSKLNESGIRCYTFVKAGLRTVNYEMIQVDADGAKAYVTEITPGAFKGCADLETVAINRTVQEIPAHEFEGLNNLRSMEIVVSPAVPGGAQPRLNIGEYAFKDCTALVDPGLSNTSGSVGRGAFEGCTALRNIYWNCTASEIPDEAFKGCTALTTFSIGTNSRASIKRIGNRAFSGCRMLTRIMGINYSVMFANIEEIGEYAFENCMRISDIWLPYPVKTVGGHAFDGCESLMNVRVYVSDTSPMVEIGEKVFGENPSDAACFDIWDYDKAVYEAYLNKWRTQLDAEYGEGAAETLIICSKRMELPGDGDIIEVDVDNDFSFVCRQSLQRMPDQLQISNLCWRNAIPDTRIYMAAKTADGSLISINWEDVSRSDIDAADELNLSNLDITVPDEASYYDVYFWDPDPAEMTPAMKKKTISADKLKR